MPIPLPTMMAKQMEKLRNLLARRRGVNKNPSSPPTDVEQWLVDRQRLLALLSGTGIEIGALHLPVHAPHLNVRHVDRLTPQELLGHYPELLGQHITNPDILDDAESLERIPSESQDFVIANHVIEHMRNPIRALLTWQRVLRPAGRLFMAVPDKHKTFDHERQLTSLAHLQEDFINPSPERDFEDFLDFAKYVSCRHFQVHPESEYRIQARKLADMDYSIHFHVWNEASFGEFLAWLESGEPAWRMRQIGFQPTRINEFIHVLEKPGRVLDTSNREV
jgi:SAM-dependent methyltransferase